MGTLIYFHPLRPSGTSPYLAITQGGGSDVQGFLGFRSSYFGIISCFVVINMKIALVHDHLNQLGGAERVVLSFKNIWPKAPIFTLLFDKKSTGKVFSNLDVRESFIRKLPFADRFFKWYLPFMPSAIEYLPVGPYDVVLSSASAYAKGVIVNPHALHICYCHTPTRYLWSDTLSYVEELRQGGLVKKVIPLMLTWLRVWDESAARRVDYFIANSQFIADRIRRYYHRESTVIYPPVDTDKFKIADKIGDYFVIVSRLRPYKRVDLAIQAFNRTRIPLKIIGIGEDEKRLRAMAKDNIEFLGAVSDEERNKIVAEARAFIHPQEEDFGITAVEAMAAGRPVIAYRSGGAKETIVHGKTGYFFEEQTWDSLADAVIRFQYQEKDFDPVFIKNWAEKFSRERFEREIKQFVESKWQIYQAENRSSLINQKLL